MQYKKLFTLTAMEPEIHRNKKTSYRDKLESMFPLAASSISLSRLISLKHNILQDMYAELDFKNDTLNVLAEIQYYINEINTNKQMYNDITESESNIRNSYNM